MIQTDSNVTQRSFYMTSGMGLGNARHTSLAAL